MPIYEYHCLNKDCGYDFEEFYTTFSAVEREEPEVACPKCSSTEKERKIASSTSFVLKGRGWARDRYGAGGGGPRRK